MPCLPIQGKKTYVHSSNEIRLLEEMYDQTKTAKVGSPTFREAVSGDEEGTRFLEKIAAVVKAHLEQVKASLDRQIASEDGKTHIVELDPTVDPIVENIINDSTESEPETEFEVLNDQPQYKPLTSDAHL